jgi:putative transposase
MRLNPQTYALTAVCHERHRIFQRTENADLMIATFFRYRDQSRYLLHRFVFMPDHLHVLLTPTESIEKTAQLLKGGYSFAIRKQYAGEVWQAGYHAHRVINTEDYRNQLSYIANNPARRHLEQFLHIHTHFLDRLDPTPAAWAE